jgi:hypothetical protein
LRTALLLGLGAAALIAGAPAAFGGDTIKIPGAVHFDESAVVMDPTSFDLDSMVVGHITSPKSDCVPNRKVVVLGHYQTESGFKPFDIARSSRRGGFSGVGAGTDKGNPLDKVRLVLKSKTIGSPSNRRTCKGDALVESLQ